MPTVFHSASHFPHRSNSDGTIDSVCPRCYVTVGTSTWEADLERIEAAHICNPARLKACDQWRTPTPTAVPPSDH